jgi:hypothetical protein
VCSISNLLWKRNEVQNNQGLEANHPIVETPISMLALGISWIWVLTRMGSQSQIEQQEIKAIQNWQKHKKFCGTDSDQKPQSLRYAEAFFWSQQADRGLGLGPELETHDHSSAPGPSYKSVQLVLEIRVYMPRTMMIAFSKWSQHRKARMGKILSNTAEGAAHVSSSILKKIGKSLRNIRMLVLCLEG